ncbi:MAG: hydroxyacid dehydrogenase [Azospirillaceae bacterium]
MPHVLVAGALHPEGMALLEAREGLTVEVVEQATPEDLRARLPEADALAIRTVTLPEEAVAAASRLKVVARHGVGYDNIPVPALTARGIPLALVGAVNALAVAEHTLFLMLACAKRCVAHDHAVRAGDWWLRNRFEGTELAGKTLLLLGFGRIGREVAARAAVFGLTVTAYDPVVPAETVAAAGVAPLADWRAALPEADFVSLHLPLSDETRNLFDAATLAAMKPSAILINTARGGLVDEAALAEAVTAGRLAGAGIDVFVEEPPEPDNPLMAVERVILSPHTAGLTLECAIRMGTVTARNVLDGLDGTLDRSLVVNREVLDAG